MNEAQKKFWAKMTPEEAQSKRKEYQARHKAKRLADIQENAKKVEVVSAISGDTGPFVSV